jgi:hypothetical protein
VRKRDLKFASQMAGRLWLGDSEEEVGRIGRGGGVVLAEGTDANDSSHLALTEPYPLYLWIILLSTAHS